MRDKEFFEESSTLEIAMSSLPPVAILAGGLATRMRPMTETVPKALLEVAGEAFIAHQLRLLAREGIRSVVLCLGHLGEQVSAFVGDGHRYNLEVSYSYDGATLRGTGGALKRALPQLGACFFVLYGDSYLDIPFRAVWKQYQKSRLPALMTVFKNEGRWDSSNVIYDGARVTLYDKRQASVDMTYIDFGLGMFSDEVFSNWPSDEPFDLADVYADLARRSHLAGWESKCRFYEIGTPRGLADADRYLQRKALRP